ncbi:Serine/threonine-protein kinase [Rhynchospora pubera]|uniref:Receptor-like serine/threonine-protein kinase n=1 Tax=Rhynchospora pubera TaxID=906938 RepID=A0AAV8DI72_9POAL|nr:Serine/threonine-protein kinase [Rhynchospora pubera]
MITEQTVVWVANRETPITNTTSSELTISDDGNLVLINQFKTVVWSTNVKGSMLNSTEAVILDSGNLVLRDKSKSSRVLWESFDHPAHTWLAGSKIGLNKTTGVNQRLISWKNENDPAPGLFSFELDPEDNEYIIYWNNSFQYWKSGKWNGQYFDSIPEMELYTHLNIFSYSFVDDKAGTYLTYWISGNWSITRIVMDISGQLKGLTWRKSTQIWGTSSVNPKAQCDVYNCCGPFGSCNSDFLDTCHCIKGFTEKNPVNWGLKDYSGGCVRSTALQWNQNGSRKGDEDRFYEMSNTVLPDNSRRIESSSGIKDCESACLNNCSCTAYSYSNGCSLWYGDLINLKDGDGVGGETIYLRLAASELPNTKSEKIIVIVVVCIGVFLVICLAFVLSLILRRKWRLRKLRRVEGRMMAFTYRDLLYITNNFLVALGRGGFGSVYKGILPDSTVVAVKRLDGIFQGDKNFRAEVSTIGMIQHLNLIRLIGFCSEHDKKLLLYEHMPTGSLDRHLFGNISARLSWNTRYQIALGISRGLHYLHEKCRDCIIHCDIKPENILLDELFVPKIADFGLAKLLGHDFSRVLTSMRGTIGYLAPEWISGTALTAKADVYSYGMMLLEIIFGKRNRRQEDNNDVSFFPAFAANKLVEGDIQCLLDVNFVDDANMEELERALKVALWCVQWEEDSRPSMGKVVQLLEGLTNVSMPPIPRPFEIFSDNPYSINYFSNTSSNVSSS